MIKDKYGLTGRYSLMLNTIVDQPSIIIDYGCNEGHFTRALKKRFNEANIYGVDVDDNYINEAKLNPCGINFLKIEDSFFMERVNLIIFSDVIEHVPKGEETYFIKKFASMLEKDGTLILSTVYKDPLGINLVLDPANFFTNPIVWFVKKIKLKSIKINEKYLWEKNEVRLHRHYSLKDLQKIYEGYFSCCYFKRTGTVLSPLCHFIISLIDMPLIYLGKTSKIIKGRGKIWKYIPQLIIAIDTKYLSLGPFSYHVILRLKKR